MGFVITQVVGEENIPANLNDVSGYLPTFSVNYAKNPSGVFVPLEVTNDKRLMVDAIGNSVITDLPRFRPRVVANKNDIYISGYGTTTILDTVSQGINQGKLEFIMIRTNSYDFEIELIVDGIQVYKLKLKDLKHDYKLRSGGGDDDECGNSEPFSLGVDNSGKIFFDKYIVPSDFSTLILKAYNTRSSTRKIYASLVKLREKIL